MEKKRIMVPFVEKLEQMSEYGLEDSLKKRGVSINIDNAPWSDFPYKPEVTACLAASETFLFVRFHVNGLGLKAVYTNTNDPVWQDSCVEVFLADADGQRYHNFEFNCIGTLLSSCRKARKVDVRPILEEEAGQVIRYSSVGLEPFEEKDGEHEWSLIIGIPFNIIGYNGRPEKLKGNFYKCANYSRWPHYLCWSRIETPAPDFHRPEDFGTIILSP